MSLKIPPNIIQPKPQLNQPNSNSNPSWPQVEIQAEEPAATKRNHIPAPIPDPTITLRLRTSTNLLPTQTSPAAPASVNSVYLQGSFQLGTQLMGPAGFHPAWPAQPLPQLSSSRQLKSYLCLQLYPTWRAPVIPSPQARQMPILLLHETSGRLFRGEQQQQETSECWYQHWPQLPLAVNTLIRQSTGQSGIPVSNGHNYIS